MAGVLIKLELNLQKLSMNAIAVKLWRSEVAKSKVREFFAKPHNNSYKMENFSEVIDEVLQELQKIDLPEKVLVELRHVVRLIGEKVFLWTWYVISDLRLELEHAEKNAWTCYGTIDEAKTFQLYWQKDPELLNCEEKAKNQFKHTLYSIACIFGQEEFMSRKLSVMKKILNDYFGSKLEIVSDDADFLITVWMCCFCGNDLEDAWRIYRNFCRVDCPEEKFLYTCAKEGYLNLFKYFANKLKNNRDRHFFWAAKETIRHLVLLGPNCKLKDNRIEIVIFSISNMSVETRIQFLKKNFHNIFSGLIDAWPYQELAFQFIDYILPFLTEVEEECLFALITDYSVHNKNYKNRDLKSKKNIGQQVLQKVLEATSRTIKERQLLYRDFALKLLDLADVPTLKIILNDPDVMTFKYIIIDEGITVFRSWVEQEQFDRLIEFMNELLDEKEKKKVKCNLNICFIEFLQEENFKLADKLLDSLADSTEEKVLLKREIDSFQILRNFYRNDKLSLLNLDRFLKWQFDGAEEEIKFVKISLRTKDFILEEFYKIWGGYCSFSVEDSKTKCAEFLNFFDFDTDELEIFKREQIIENEYFIQIFCKHLSLSEDFKTVDELLKFCCVPPENVTEIKQNLRDRVQCWILVAQSVKMTFALVNWVTEENENLKKEIIGKYINSPYFVSLFCRSIKTCSCNCCDNILILMNLWVKPYGDVSEIMEHCSQMLKFHEVLKIKDLLEALRRKGFISKSYAEGFVKDARDNSLFVTFH